MGTRHMIGAVIDGEVKLAQYGQWDGYPSGQGVDILNFLREADLELFAQELRKLEWVTDEEIKAAADEVGSKDGWMTMEQAEQFRRLIPGVSRDLGAKVLTEISYGSAPKVQNSWDFAEDSLFCEWAYVLDMDAKVLEVYQGFQQSGPVQGRWADVELSVEQAVKPEGSQYYPVTLVAEIPFDALPDNEEFSKIELQEEEK